MQVWPYLLGVYRLDSTADERSAQDLAAQLEYSRLGMEWRRAAAAALQREHETFPPPPPPELPAVTGEPVKLLLCGRDVNRLLKTYCCYF